MKLQLAAVARPAPIVSLALLAVAAVFAVSAGCSSGEQCKSVVPAQTCTSGDELQICADVSSNACHFEIGGTFISCSSCSEYDIETCEQNAFSQCAGTGSSSGGTSGSSSGYSGGSSGSSSGSQVTCYDYTGGGTCGQLGELNCAPAANNSTLCCPPSTPYYCPSFPTSEQCNAQPCSEGECIACQ
jgi:hypothetical protein